jgi:hypothetical protein
MAPLAEDERHLDQLVQALDGARTEPPWAETMALPDAVGELVRWLNDDGQWHRGGATAWRTLIADVRGSLAAYPSAVVRHAGDREALLADLKECVAAFGDDALRTAATLRRRLHLLAGQLRQGLRTTAALRDAWQDLRQRSESSDQAELAARRLLALARWCGHDPTRLREALTWELVGQRPRPQAPAWHRLRRAQARLLAAPPRATVVVWLRLLFASIRRPTVIDLGSAVTLYQGTWLRSAFAAGDQSGVPPEFALDKDGFLAAFCHVSSAEQREEAEHGPGEIVDAFARVELQDVLLSEALPRARRTVATLSALGALYGAEPSLWRLDNSYVTFHDGGYGTSTFSAPPVEAPTITERVGVTRDPTAEILLRSRKKLAAHLPVGDGPMAAAAELLTWLRDARSSPPPSRLVLCDRVIETVSSWAGISKPQRFVEDHLIPSWAYGRMNSTLLSIAQDIRHDDHRRHYPPETNEYAAWKEIIDHPQLGFQDAQDGRFSVDLGGVIRSLAWLRERVRPDSDVHRCIEEMVQRLSSGQAAARWFDDLCRTALANERRRSRTRNALMHGGPLTEATVTAVLPFAEYMASEAIGHTVESQLDGVDTTDFFLGRAANLRRMHRRLKAGEAPDTAMFWREQVTGLADAPDTTPNA